MAATLIREETASTKERLLYIDNLRLLVIVLGCHDSFGGDGQRLWQLVLRLRYASGHVIHRLVRLLPIVHARILPGAFVHDFRLFCRRKLRPKGLRTVHRRQVQALDHPHIDLHDSNNAVHRNCGTRQQV